MRAILVGPVCTDQGWFRKTLKRQKYVTRENLSERTVIIAIDGGLSQCIANKIRPDFAIGDWDSLRCLLRSSFPKAASKDFQSGEAKLTRLLSKTKHVTLSEEKDRSDLSYALEYVIKQGAAQIMCMGVTGGRPDHQLASLYELMKWRKRGPPITALGPEARYEFLKPGSHLLQMKKGSIFSIFSLISQQVKGLTIQGSKYKMTAQRLGASSLGLSNVATTPRVRIKFTLGSLLVIIPPN